MLRFAPLLIPLLLATPVSAATLVINGGVQFPGPLQYDVSGDTVTQVGTFTPFDSSLGALQSVHIQRLNDLGASLTLSNLAPGDYSGFLYSETRIFSADDTLLYSSTTGHSNGMNRTVLSDGTVPSGGTGVPNEVAFVEGDFLGGFALTGGLEYFMTLPPITGQFTYSSRFYFRVDGPGLADSATFDADHINGLLAIGGQFSTVEYNYTPVPEPGTSLLVGVGLALLGGKRSRRPV